jgi:hypothetical protein
MKEVSNITSCAINYNDVALPDVKKTLLQQKGRAFRFTILIRRHTFKIMKKNSEYHNIT